MRAEHRNALLQALFVTFLWSTSWVLIKLGLRDIPALTFAGLRYGLAFLILLSLVWLRRKGAHVGLRRSDLGGLVLLGVVYYAVTQGGQFLALDHLSAQMASLVLSFSPAAVALIAVPALGERLTGRQWVGILIYLAGAVLYFVPLDLRGGDALGLAIVTITMLANAASSVLGRAINRGGRLHPLTVTVISMGVGATLLLGTGLSVQGMPTIGGRGWLIIICLAVVNTALAFTLWNHTLKTLTATESSVINNTMLLQIALLAWLFLGEGLGVKEIAAFLIATVGILAVQLRGPRADGRAAPSPDPGPENAPP